jgi:hypothetical protein
MSFREVESSHRAKRRRDECLHEEIKNHTSLYFMDGDIVLLSLPKDHFVTAFRVDKVYLSRLPSRDAVEKYDGVPLVRLHDEAE